MSRPGASPPKKRRALLLGAPKEGEVPESNRFQYRAPRGKEREDVPVPPILPEGDGSREGDGTEDAAEDDFAQMVSLPSRRNDNR